MPALRPDTCSSAASATVGASAMQSLTEPDAGGACHYSSGVYGTLADTPVKPAHPPCIEPDKRLRSPILDVAAREHMIAPSLSFHASEGVAAGARDNEGSKRGTAIHRALDLMSRSPPYTAAQVRQRIRLETAAIDEPELDRWMDEASKIVNDKSFEPIFKPAADRKTMNELPVMYRHRGQSVYGLIDRLVISDDSILLIDYKTHRLDSPEQMQGLAEGYREQMSLYRAGVEKLWPGRAIKSGLLFTHSARLIWLDPATVAGT